MENVISTWLNDWDDSFVYSGFEDNSSDNVSHGSHHSVTEQENGWSSDKESSNSVGNQLFFENDGTKWSTFLIILFFFYIILFLYFYIFFWFYYLIMKWSWN